MHYLDEELIRVPIVAIGGITSNDIDAIMATGVSGIALSGTILQADDPVMAMQDIVVKMNNIQI